MTNLNEYHLSISKIGLEATWDLILSNYFPSEFFSEDRLGGLYEDGLAYENKIEKKALGKYYTPIDVANVMAEYFLQLPGENICDLCCGTGNLILAVLERMGEKQAKNALKNGHVYLYDIDLIAQKICKAILINRYGECANNINIISEDCLTREICFPKNSKIISNPPYGKQDSLINYSYPCAKTTKELYVAFMEKILFEKIPAVIITPHSFLGGSTFKKLREEMNNQGGIIFSFDNVPGNIFKGKKFGIFNSNEANSTRAAITIINPEKKGFKISPFIRFKNDEREKILDTTFLNSLLPENYQNNKDEIFYRIEKETEKFCLEWLKKKNTFKELLSSKKTDFKLDVPNTCRYFVTGAKKDLLRTGKITLYFNNKNDFYLGYAFLNSSLAYYWHRICNGGITYPIALLKNMPIFGSTTEELKKLCDKMIQEEENFIVLKKNAGEYQENIKFPMSYREELNSLLLNQINQSAEGLLKVHSNSCFSCNYQEED